MKTRRSICGVVFTALLAFTGAGQDVERQPPNDARDERPHRPHGPAGREEIREGRGRPFLDRWLQGLQVDRPQEFERLMDLKRRDPPAFAAETRRMLRQDLGQKLQRERPAIFQAIQGLPAEDHEWLMDRLFGGEGRMTQGQRPGGGPGFGPKRGPEGGDNDMALRRRVDSFRTARNDEERKRESDALREHLRQSFVRKHEQRRQEMDQMAEQLKEARVLLQEREKNREAIIDRRMQELTAPPPPPPRGGRPPATE